MARLLWFVAYAVLAASTASAQPAKVRVGYINNVQSAALVHLHSIQGEENLDIELVPFTRYPDVQKALSVNSVDVGVIAPNGLPAAVAQGDRNVIGVLDLVYGGNSFVARKGLSIQKFEDLRGKRIALAEGGISWMMFIMLLDKHGMTYNDINPINFSGATDIVAALKRSDVDVVDLWEPFVAEAVAGGIGTRVEAVNFRETPLAALNGMLGANRQFARANEGVLVRTLRLVLKAEQQLQQDKELWVRIVRGYSKLDDATVKLALATINYGGPQVSLSKMNSVATFIAKAGIVQTDVTGKLGDSVDARYLAQATGMSEAAVLK